MNRRFVFCFYLRGRLHAAALLEGATLAPLVAAPQISAVLGAALLGGCHTPSNSISNACALNYLSGNE